MSQFLTVKHLNELHSLCTSKSEERKILLDAISDMFDSGMSCKTIEECIELSEFNHQNNNY